MPEQKFESEPTNEKQDRVIPALLRKIRKCSTLDAVRNELDAYVQAYPQGERPSIILGYAFQALRPKTILDFDSVISTLDSSYGIKLNLETTTNIIGRQQSFLFRKKLAHHLISTYNIQCDARLLEVILSHSTSKELSVQCLREFWQSGREIPANVLNTMLRSTRGYEAIELIDYCEKEYRIVINSETLALLANRVETCNEFKKIIETKFADSGVVPDEQSLVAFLSHAQGLEGVKNIIQFFKENFGISKMSTITLNASLRALSSDEIEKGMHEISRKFDIKPEISTHRLMFMILLEKNLPDAHVLDSARRIVLKLAEYGYTIEYIRSKELPDFKITFALYLFYERKYPDAIKLLSSVLQEENLLFQTKLVAVTMILAFLPAEHALRAAVEQNLKAHGDMELLTQATQKVANFNDLFRSWWRHDMSQLGTQYSSVVLKRRE